MTKRPPILASSLQALGVVVVDLLASVRALASGGAVEADTTALGPVSSTGTAGVGGSRGGGRLSSGGDGLDGAGRVGGGAAGRATGEGRADGAELDVGEDDLGVGGVGLNLGGDTRGGRALTTVSTGAATLDRVGGVEPEHVGGMVVPDGHDKDHGLGEGLAHLLQATLDVEVTDIAESSLLSIAERLGDRVARDTSNVGLGVLNDLAVLDVETLDLAEIASGVLDELGDDGELGAGVDGLALTVEGGVAHAVRVEVATIGIAGTAIAVGGVGTAAGVTLAHVLVDGGAGVGSEGGRDLVGLPDIHLRAASTVVTNTSVRVVGGGRPALNVTNTVDVLEITGALSVAVTGTVLGTSLVGGVLGLATIKIHGDEVEGAVETAADAGHIDIEGELVAEELEACRQSLLAIRYSGKGGRSSRTLVGIVAVHEVSTGTNVGRVLALGDELKAERVAAGLNTIGRRVLSAINAALGSAVGVGAADGGIPLVAVVAVGAAGESVSPAPVGINGDGAGDVGASGRSALGPVKGRVGLGSERANSLGVGRGHEGREGSELGEHGEDEAEG